MAFMLDDGWDFCTAVVRAGNTAYGVYCRVGSWLASNLTDGFVPREVAMAIGSPELASRLVAAGLWEAVEGGYLAVDYLTLNATAEKVAQRRKADAERKANWRARASAKGAKGGERGKGKRGTSDTTRESAGSHGVTDGKTPRFLTPPKGGKDAPDDGAVQLPTPDEDLNSTPERDERDWLWRPDEDPAITRERNKRGAAAIRALTRSTDKDDPSRDERLTRLGIDPTTELLQIVPPSLMIVQSRGRLYGQPPGKHTQLDPDDDQEEAS